MRATTAVAMTTALVLRRHLAQSVGGRVAASSLVSLVVVAAVVYNVFAFQFLTRFLPADLPESSLISGVVLIDALTAAQLTSAGGIAVLVLVLAPAQSELRIAAQVLSARRTPSRIGESLPFVALMVLGSSMSTVGPSLYLTAVIDEGPLSLVILLGVNVGTAVAIALVAESVRLLTARARLTDTMSHLAAVLAAVAVVAVAVYDSTAAARQNRPPATAVWVDLLTALRGVDGSVTAAAAVVVAVGGLIAGVLAVRLAQPAEPLSHPHALLSLRRVLPAGAGWLGREFVMAVRQPLAQISTVVSAVGIVLIGLAIRSGVVPLEVAAVGAGMLAAAPLELGWARTAPWVWMYRKDRAGARCIVAAQLVTGTMSALLLSVLLYIAAGVVPSATALVHHSTVVAAAAAIAYLAGVLVPASASMPAAVVVTSTLAVGTESALIWAASQVDDAAPGLSSVVLAAAAVFAAGAAVLRISQRLNAD